MKTKPEMPARKKKAPARRQRKKDDQLVNTPWGEMTPDEAADYVAEQEAVERKLRREFGEDVIDPLDTMYRLRSYRLSYAERNMLALMFTVRLCHARKATLPRWALKALANAFDEYLQAPHGTKSSLDKIFLRRGKGKSDPKTIEAERLHRGLIYQLVGAAMENGYSQNKASELAANIMWWKYRDEIADRYWGSLKTETVRQIYKRFEPRKSEETGSLFMHGLRLVREWEQLSESERDKVISSKNPKKS